MLSKPQFFVACYRTWAKSNGRTISEQWNYDMEHPSEWEDWPRWLKKKQQEYHVSGGRNMPNGFIEWLRQTSG